MNRYAAYRVTPTRSLSDSKRNRLPICFDNLVATARRAVVALLLLIPLSEVTRADAPPHRLPETPQFEHFGPEDGLPSSTVYTLAQDAKGYLWIGTADGLARYDGVGFKVFRHDPEDPHSLPSNVVQALHVDAQQRLWIACEGGGLSMLAAPAQSRFIHVNHATLADFQMDDVYAIASDQHGTLWLGGYAAGLYGYNPANGSLQIFQHREGDPDSLINDTVLSLLYDKGDLWIGTLDGFQRLTGNKFATVDLPDATRPQRLIASLYKSPQGQLHIGTRAGLFLRGTDGNTQYQPEAPNSAVMTALVDQEWLQWLGMRDGLWSRREGEPWHRHPAAIGRRGSLRGDVINALLEDHESGLWIATVGGGLSRLSPQWRNFSVFQVGQTATSVPRGVATSADGSVWAVSLPGGLDRIDLQTGLVTAHLGPGSFPDERLHAVLEDQHGLIWIGHSSGLVRYHKATGTTIPFGQDSAHPTPPGFVDQLLETPDGIWLSAQGAGLQKRASNGDVIEDIRVGQQGLDSADTEQIALGPKGELWWSGAIGLRRRSLTSGQFEPLQGAPTDRVFGFDFAHNGDLWLHRLQALERYQIDGDRLSLVERIDQTSGLPIVESGGVIVDLQGSIWLTTARGLVRYRPANDSRAADLRIFGVRDGLPSIEFHKRPPAMNAEGILIASTLEGVVAFDPQRLRSTEAPSTLQWESLSVARGGRRSELALGEPTHLHHSDTDLRIAVRLLSFADPSANRYRFRLQGVDAGWVETGNIPERSYPALPAGDYLLEVSATNADGQWATPLQAQIHMAPAWWLSSPAKALYALSLLLLGALLLRGWRARLAERHQLAMAEQAKQLAEEASRAKGRFLSTLGHEIRTPMTGLLGMNELLLHSDLQPAQRQQAEAVRRSGQMMLRLLNESLDIARIDAGKLQIAPQATDLHQLLRDVAELQSAPAQRKGLRFELDIDASLPVWVNVDPLRLQQILLNLTSNAIKFTETGAVRLRAVAQATQGDRVSLRFEVHDSGAGMDADTLARLFQPFEQAQGARTAQQFGGSGLGLLISRQLAEAMHGEVKAASTVGEGSTFSLSLPVELTAADQPVAPIPIQTPTPATQSLLLVEDEADVAAAVGGLLRQMGHAVDHAEHALQALGLIAQRDYAQAVLDLDLPGIDGLTLAGMLRKQRPNMRLIALTARAEADTEERALAAGFAVFLRKPMSLAQLRDAIAGGDPSS